MKIPIDAITTNVSRYGTTQMLNYTKEEDLPAVIKEIKENKMKLSPEMIKKELSYFDSPYIDVPDGMVMKIYNNITVPKGSTYFLMYPSRKGYAHFRPMYIEALNNENRYGITIEDLDKKTEELFAQIEKATIRRVKSYRKRADDIEQLMNEYLK